MIAVHPDTSLRATELSVLSVDPHISSLASFDTSTLAAGTAPPHNAIRDVETLFARLDVERPHPRVVILDEGCCEIDEVVRRVAQRADRAGLIVIAAVRDTTRHLVSGADVVCDRTLLPAIIGAARATVPARTLTVDTLLAVTTLDGALDHALEILADQLTVAFGVERCLISLHGDSSGASAATGTRTWSSLVWSETAERCRHAAMSGTTVIAPAVDSPAGRCESYVAVPLSTATGTGFIGLVVDGAYMFDRELRQMLTAVANRIGRELAWRSAHTRAANELDRLVNGPGLDRLLGTWNNAALRQLAAMQVSGARRSNIPLAVLAIDVVGLATINTRFGLDVGDRVLRRIGDAVQTAVREEDIVGRWAGDEFVVVLHGTSVDKALLVGHRVRNAIRARSLDLVDGGSLTIDVSVGLATLQTGDDGTSLVLRASRAAAKAQTLEVGVLAADSTIAGPPTRPSARRIEQTDEDVATTLGGMYRILHEISRGGMGVVYRAEDRALERPVAIKMLRSDLSRDRELVEQFRVEAAMLAHLQHPNLVQIYSFGHSGDESYFVMELVEGESLEQAIERHRGEGSMTTPADVVAAIEHVASALDALHDRGIVHRDVKPANVIRDPFRGRTVLVDVGIARRYGQHATTAGTPGFVAPEVLAGQEATARSDVYGLAATAYASLALTRAFPTGDLHDTLRRQMEEALRPPSELRPELAPLDTLLLRGLSRDPEKRPPSAGAFARELAVAAAKIGAPSDPDAVIIRPRTMTRSADRGMEGAKTRGVVFRSVPRALGMRDAGRLRDAIGGRDPDLSRALHEAAPQGWLPSSLFVRLLTVAPEHLGRDRAALARDIGRMTVRSSFRKFFPSSSATLVPERTLSAIRTVWSRYQAWGTVSCMTVHSTEVVVKIVDPLPDPALCVWTSGMLEQLVALSGGRSPQVQHESCAACGEDACLFRITWERDA